MGRARRHHDALAPNCAARLLRGGIPVGDPFKALADSAGPGGLAVLAILVLILTNVLALGREVTRERAIADKLLPLVEKLAQQMERLLDELGSGNGRKR